MSRLTNLQVVGPAVLFAAIAMAEGCAYALAQFPSSSWLWYLNLEVFRLFQKSHAVLGGFIDLPFSQLWLVAFPLIVSAFAGLYLRYRLLIALASNLSLVYACFIVYSWYNLQYSVMSASLHAIPLPDSTDLLLFAILALASLLSSFVSHLFYIRELRY